jgi:uncharacterized protein (TIGR03437 family)
VEIGGMNAVVHYKGVAPGFAGLYQFNVEIPASGLSAGDHAIFIHTGNFVTQPGVTIRVQP